MSRSIRLALVLFSLALTLTGSALACRTFRDQLDALETQAMLQHQRTVCGVESDFTAAYAAAHFEEPPPLVPMDVQWEIYDGTILSLYGVGLRELPQEGYYSADLYTVLYHRNPFRSTPLLLGELWVTAQDAEEALFVPYPIGFPLSGTTHQNFNATYSVIEVSGDFAGQNITLHYQYLDTSFALDISLPWEEVLP